MNYLVPALALLSSLSVSASDIKVETRSTVSFLLRRIRQRHVSNPKQLRLSHRPILGLFHAVDMLQRVLLDGDEHAARRPQLVLQLLVPPRRRRAHMDRIVRPRLRKPAPPVPVHEAHDALPQQRTALRRLGHVGGCELDQLRDVLQADDLPVLCRGGASRNALSARAFLLDQLGQHVGQVARARANIQHARAGAEEREERLRGVGMHVRGADGGFVPDRLRAVGVRVPGSVVCAIDLERENDSISRCLWVVVLGLIVVVVLLHTYPLHGVADSRVLDDAIVVEVVNELSIGRTRAAPGHSEYVTGRPKPDVPYGVREAGEGLQDEVAAVVDMPSDW
jgi:hypothetical protein